MDRRAFETALAELRKLVEWEGTPEEHLQDWFERNDIALKCHGYVRFIPKPELKTVDGSVYIPDFLAQKVNGTWEVFEIKRPDSRILKDAARRQTFYAEFETYLAQCVDYQQYFTDKAHRDAIRDRYGIEVGEPPEAMVVAGRDLGLDKLKVHRMLAGRAPHIRFHTYDDVARQIEEFRALQFGKYENIPGFSLHTAIHLVGLPSPNSEHFIFDLGTNVDRNRISIFVDDTGCVHLRLIDSNGVSREVPTRGLASRLPQAGFAHLGFEVGIGLDCAILSIEVDGIVEAWTTVERQEVPLSVSKHYVLGSDVTGTAKTGMCLAEQCLWDRSLTLRERLDLRDYFAVKYGPHYSGPCVQFTGNQFLHSTGHPNFLPSS